MEAAFFVLNVALFGLWIWATVDCAIAQRGYGWLITVATAPVVAYVGAMIYLLNFKFLPAIGNRPVDEVIAQRRRERLLRAQVADRGLVQDHFALADFQFGLKRWQETLVALKPVLAADEDNLQAHYRAGVALLRTGRPGPAEEHLDFVVSEDRHHADSQALIRLAEAQQALGKDDAAEATLRVVLEREYHPEATMLLARRVESRGERAEALELAKRLVADSARNSAVWHARHKTWIAEAKAMARRLE